MSGIRYRIKTNTDAWRIELLNYTPWETIDVYLNGLVKLKNIDFIPFFKFNLKQNSFKKVVKIGYHFSMFYWQFITLLYNL